MKLFDAIITTSVLVCLISCTKPADDKDFFSTDKTAVNLPAVGGMDSIRISTNIAWSLTGVPSWISINPTTGSGDQTVTFQYQANVDPGPRMDSFSVNASGFPAEVIHLNQAGASHYLVPDSTMVTVAAINPGLAVFDSIMLNSSEPWGMIIQEIDRTWLGSTTYNGPAGTSAVRLSLASNPFNFSRFSTVRIFSRGAPLDTVFVTVWQNFGHEVTGSTFSGRGGDIIYVGGSGFSFTASENIVKINGKIATITEAGPTALSVIVPEKAGSGLIEVTTGSFSGVSPVPFNYQWVAVVADVAGSTDGYQDGPGSNAKFSRPSGIGIDQAGNLFVADYNNYKVRRISPSGWVSTMPGFTDSYFPGTVNYALPSDISVDPDGNVLVAEVNNSRISRIGPDSMVSTIAGGVQNGYLDGPGSQAILNHPTGLFTDATGNTFVAEIGGHHIRKISPAGQVSTVAGGPIQGYADGTGTSALFNMPFSVTGDAAGNLYVSDHWNNKLRKITSQGVVTTINSGGEAYYLFRPLDLTIDENGVVWVGDSDNKIHCFDTHTGTITVLEEFRDAITKEPIEVSGLYGIAAGKNGIIYFSDYYNNKIRKIIDLK